MCNRSDPASRVEVESYVMARVEKLASGCWEWTGSRYGNGYGRLRGRVGDGALAHRVSYELWVGTIAEEMVIDHLCRNRACVNPHHLEPVPQRENVMRGESLFADQAKRTHCPQGHEYDETNTYSYRGLRYCRICRREHDRASRARRRDSVNARQRERYAIRRAA